MNARGAASREEFAHRESAGLRRFVPRRAGASHPQNREGFDVAGGVAIEERVTLLGSIDNKLE